MTENQNIECKASWRDEYLKWICGFANAQGGVLEIGRNDRGEVVGAPDATRLLENLPNKIRDILGIVPDVNLLQADGKDVIRITVEPYPYPVSYKGQYHVRIGSTKQELKGSALDHFLLRKTGKHWDAVPLTGVSVDDLDSRVIAQFRERAARSNRLGLEILEEENAELIEKLRLMDGEYMKRAAVLLFHPDPEAFVTGAYIKIGYFESDSELRYHDEIHGDLFTQVDKTIDLLMTKYLKASISYEGVHRIETYPVPDIALREALLNAVAHKDYASGTPIQISVYDDKILFWNNGRLPEDWTVESLLAKHASQPFNPDIANAFFRCGMIEAWGRGIEKMRSACESQGVPTPVLRVEPTGMWVEFENWPPKEVTGEVAGEVTGEVANLLVVCNGEMTRKAIQDRLGLRGADNFRNLYLRPAIDIGLIEMTIPDKPKSRLQKYRLTEKGKAVLAAMRSAGH